MVSRREFLTGSASSALCLSFGLAAPRFLQSAALASVLAHDDSERILVVLQLSGGNDGLNTVVPFRDPVYRGSRPTLAIHSDDVLGINQDLGFHPATRGLADLLERNQLCIVQGVGYENPNRSHFESMDIWHTCQRKTETRADGWLGRALETAGHGSISQPTINKPLSANASGQIPAIHLGNETRPLALSARSVQVPSIRSLDEFRLETGTGDLTAAIGELSAVQRDDGNGLLGFVQSNLDSALNVSQRLESAGSSARTQAHYPDTSLASRFQTVASLIDSGLPTRIYYLTLDGFDTHSRQADAHAALLRDFAASSSGFLQDLTERGHADRVTMLVFSEFGRRLKENASEGTDHGAAAPVFLIGNQVKPGPVGALPDLTDLDDGDIRYHTDFRRVYATVLEKWLGIPAAPVLGDGFPVLDVLTPRQA